MRMTRLSCGCLLLCVNALISGSLLVSNAVLTYRQSVYADAINSIGRVRYLLSRYGMLLQAEIVGLHLKYLGGEGAAEPLGHGAEIKVAQPGTANAVMSEVLSISCQLCGELCGESTDAQSKFEAPELPHADLKNKVSLLVRRLRVLNQTVVASARAGVADEAADVMGDMATLLTLEAQDSMHVALGLQCCHVLCQACFYVFLTFVFKLVWDPLVKSVSELQAVQRQQHSLLRSDFDAVIEIGTCHPFEVQRSSRVLDDLVGKPMLGESILDAALNETARGALTAFLSANVSFHAKLQQPSVGLVRKGSGIFGRVRCWCHRILAGPALEDITEYPNSPLAPKINSQWSCDVEILIVGSTDGRMGGKGALLALRLLGLGNTTRECEEPSISSFGMMMDFHSWRNALAMVYQIPINLDSPGVPGYERPDILGGNCGNGNVVHVPSDRGGACLNMRPQKTALSRRSSTASSSTTWTDFVKRRLDLDVMEVVLVDGLQIDNYSLRFASEDFDASLETAGGRPDFLSCLLGEHGVRFVKWLHNSINILLTSDESDQLTYEHEVWFRPPSAACASSKIILAAESVRCIRGDERVNGDCKFHLQLFDVSQVSNSPNPGNQSVRPRLPVVDETDSMATL